LGAISRRQNRGIKYAGRKPSASPATGNKYMHKKEQAEMLEAILTKPVNRIGEVGQ
jgi:2-oxoglutarate dehydrogenase complex dehydrogenase (E1) component-like enzyme